MLTAVADKRLESLLIGMSLVDRSDSTIAVQQALYALIALRIYGSKIALIYKIRAIYALRNSMRKGLVAKDGLQHIATGLLLSLYEVSFTSKTNMLRYLVDFPSRSTTLPSSLISGYFMQVEPSRLGRYCTPSTRVAKEMLDSFWHGYSTMTFCSNLLHIIGNPQNAIRRYVRQMIRSKRRLCSQVEKQR